jgi:hypothetical protein
MRKRKEETKFWKIMFYQFAVMFGIVALLSLGNRLMIGMLIITLAILIATFSEKVFY